MNTKIKETCDVDKRLAFIREEQQECQCHIERGEGIPGSMGKWLIVKEIPWLLELIEELRNKEQK